MDNYNVIRQMANSGSYFTTFNNVSIFTMDTNIFKLNSSTLFLVGVMRLIQ